VNATAERRSLVAGIVELLRPPNVFTAIADSLAGLALGHAGLLAVPSRGFWLVPASASLYLGGMALNDYFDREVDARERPERPIPSGAVPPSVAGALGAGLLAAGLLFAWGAGAGPLLVAIPLAAAIVIYDGLLKGTPIGFLNMGLCRGLNLAMPLALAPSALAPAAWLAPLFLTAYVSVLTYLARDEVAGNPLARARRGVAAMAAVGGMMAGSLAAMRSSLAGWIFLLLVIARATSLFGPLRENPSGPATGRAIGGGILLIPLLDATFVAAGGSLLSAILVAALALPAIALRRLYSPT
jgi:4-hydroxybenzoate polyprenyltransferase